MRFTQLKVFAQLAAVAVGLTAVLAAVPTRAAFVPGVPARVSTPAGAAARPAVPDDDKAAKELEAKELKALQGKWRVVKMEADGKEVPAEELAKMTMVVEKDIIQPEAGDPNKDERLQFKLDPGKTPKEIDLTPLGGPEAVKGKVMPAIYKLDGDTLVLCIRDRMRDQGRPKKLEAGEGIGLITLERVKDEKEELAALASEWKGVRVNVSGREVAADEVAGGKWAIKGAEIVVTAEGDPEQKAGLKLDPAATPPTIDLTFTTGNEKGTVMRGIYFRQGDRWTMAFRDPKVKKDDRPAELKTGDEVMFVVLERAKKE